MTDTYELRCGDCDVPLTEENTEVDASAAYWVNAKWQDEDRCATCKENAADGEVRYPEPGGGFYEQNLRDAGRGHLL